MATKINLLGINELDITGISAVSTLNGVTSFTVASSGGTVTSFSAGNLSPLFTTSVANPTTTPALSFTLSTQTANTVFAGPASGSAAAPTFRGLVAADLPSFTSSNISGFFGGPICLDWGTPTTTTGSSWSATFGYFILFYLPINVTVSKATIYVQAVSASATKQMSFGIYPASAGSTALVKAAVNVSTGQATGVRGTTFASTPLTSGWYYYVITGNTTDASFLYWNAPQGNVFNIMNANGVRTGSVAVSTPGTLDTMLGTLTASTALGGPGICCFFE